MNYRIGLDIGIGSVGWAVLANDPITDEPERIVDLGVRTFTPNEVAKTGESTAKDRRKKRGVRRRKRRKELRKENLKSLFNLKFGVKDDDLSKLLNKDVYEIRTRGLDEKLTPAEIEKAMLNILKHRGFKSTRKSENSKENGLLLTATSENSKLLSSYRTFGEAIFKDNGRFFTTSEIVCENGEKKLIKNYDIRNHAGDYKNCFLRDELKTEIELILRKQAEFYPVIDENFINMVCEIFSRQRSFDVGPGGNSPYKASFEIGNCTFLPEEKRAPKASWTFEYFNALSKLNSLKIGEDVLTDDQKKLVIEKIQTKENLTFEQIRKMFDVPLEKTFNLCRYIVSRKKQKDGEEISLEEQTKQCEKTQFISMRCSYQIKKVLGLENSIENAELIDETALMLSLCKSDDKRKEYIESNKILSKLSNEQIDKVLGLSFEKFGSLSSKAMKKIIPYLEEGLRYDEACKKAGFNHSSFEHEKMKYLKGDKIEERMQDVTSNVVKRSVHQTLRVVNEIISKYGSPAFLNIELARELSKNFQDRNNYIKKQEDNRLANEKTKQDLENEFKIPKATGIDVLKYRLYNEQNGKCAYSGKPIEYARIFEPNYLQIDHILPFSKSMDDSFNNKVLVLASENQNKGDRTPFEYFGSDTKKWNEFKARVETIPNRTKQRNLLKEHFDQADQEEFISRNLNDTQYMARFLLNLFQDFLLFAPNNTKKEKVVKSVSGSVTSYLRKCWGINKIREDGDIHHCIDATVIACVTEGQIQKITNFNKFREKFAYNEKENKYISRLTGEVITPEEKRDYESKQFKLEYEKLPYPYKDFKTELEIRSKVHYFDFDFSEEEKLELAKIGYEEEQIAKAKPVFISRMKTIKKTGAIHKDTMMSLREYAETKNLIKSVSVDSLKLSNKVETEPLKDDKYPEFSIENYYRPKDDRLLYLKLKEIMQANGGIIPKNMVVHKPKSDGTDGPVVKKVKMYEKSTSIVETPQGGAANDSMYRVDVFEKDKKFYLCPVYKADVYAHRLPNKVIEIGKDWTELDDSYSFKFSLYQNDLIKITSKKEIELKKNFDNPKSNKPDSIKNNEVWVYYQGTGIAVAQFKIISHDNCYAQPSLGVKTLLDIEKFHVDVMGNIFKAPKEERESL